MLIRLAERYAAVPAQKLARLRHRLSAGFSRWRQGQRRNRQIRLAHRALCGNAPGERFFDIAFTHAITALAAKLAAIDGPMRQEETFTAFFRLFTPLSGDESTLRQMFRQAAEDRTDAQIYARQVRALFPLPRHHAWRHGLFLKLQALAGTGGKAPGLEKRLLLQRIGLALGLRARELRHLAPPPHRGKSPYRVLEVKRNWSEERIRKAYLQQVRDLHPDRVMARGGNRESVEAAGQRIAELNNAYATIRRIKKK